MSIRTDAHNCVRATHVIRLAYVQGRITRAEYDVLFSAIDKELDRLANLLR